MHAHTNTYTDTHIHMEIIVLPDVWKLMDVTSMQFVLDQPMKQSMIITWPLIFLSMALILYLWMCSDPKKVRHLVGSL